MCAGLYLWLYCMLTTFDYLCLIFTDCFHWKLMKSLAEDNVLELDWSIFSNTLVFNPLNHHVLYFQCVFHWGAINWTTTLRGHIIILINLHLRGVSEGSITLCTPKTDEQTGVSLTLFFYVLLCFYSLFALFSFGNMRHNILMLLPPRSSLSLCRNLNTTAETHTLKMHWLWMHHYQVLMKHKRICLMLKIKRTSEIAPL